MTALANRNSTSHHVLQAEDIFGQHGDFIRTVIARQVKNPELVDDIYQDFFLLLITRPIPENTTNIKGYLYKAVVNHVIDAKRRVIRYREHVNQYASHIKISRNYSVSPKNSSYNAEKAFRFVQNFTSPAETRAMHMRYVHEKNLDEIAEKMGVKKKTVIRYISTGLSKIRRIMLNKD